MSYRHPSGTSRLGDLAAHGSCSAISRRLVQASRFDVMKQFCVICLQIPPWAGNLEAKAHGDPQRHHGGQAGAGEQLLWSCTWLMSGLATAICPQGALLCMVCVGGASLCTVVSCACCQRGQLIAVNMPERAPQTSPPTGHTARWGVHHPQAQSRSSKCVDEDLGI